MDSTNRTSKVDLERLARGEPIAPDDFRDILRNPDAIRELRRTLMVRSLVEGEEVSPNSAELPDTDIDFAELAQYLQTGSLPDSSKQAAAEALLEKFFPQRSPAMETDLASAETAIAPAKSAVGDTELMLSDAETKIGDASPLHSDDPDDGSTKIDS